MGLHYKGFTYTCVFKRLLGMLLVVVGVFLLAEYMSWETWSCAQCKITKCSEAIYTFENGGWFDSWFTGIYTDTRLIEGCKAGKDTSQLFAKLHVNDNSTKDKYTKLPNILTKCGTVTPTHISINKHTIERVRNKTVDCVVPNIVHYVSLGHWKFSFLNYLSFKSVDRHIKPEYIYIHGDGLPYGYWWNRTIDEIYNLYHVYRESPERIQRRKPPWIQHKSDILRLQTLLDNGGIYLDTDVLVLKSFDDLRKYPVTLGRETSFGLGSGIILAAPSAPFVCVWLQVFRTYNPWPWHWAKYAVETPNKLARVMPDYVHIEEDSLQRPSWAETDLLFEKRINWENKYAMHIWKRRGVVPNNQEEIRTLNTTLGEVMRFIYFGSSEVRDEH